MNYHERKQDSERSIVDSANRNLRVNLVYIMECLLTARRDISRKLARDAGWKH